MSNALTGATASRRRRHWRHNEKRASPKLIAKRVTEVDHQLLTKYAEDHGVKISQMLEPFIADLIKRAREHCDQLNAGVTPNTKAS